MKKRLSLFVTMALMAGTSIFTACKKDEVAKKYGQLNVINTSPEAPGFNILLDSMKINDFVLQYGAVTGYKELEAGRHIAKINTYLADSTMDTTVLKTEFIVKEKEHYTLFLIDSFYKMNAMYVPDVFPSFEDGKAHVRFVQLSPNTRRLDVAHEKNGAVVFGNMFFKDVTGYTALPAGVYDWELRGAGTDTVIAKLPTMVFNTGKIYTVYTRGFDSTIGKRALTAAVFMNKN